MTILVLFERFSGKFCLKFFDPNSDCLAKQVMMHFVRTFSIMRA